MSEIISKDAIRAKARAAHAAGRSRDSHGFNWHAPALDTWLEEFDRCEAGSIRGNALLAGGYGGSPQSHIAPVARRHIDLEQTA